jgi:hypothetical protein
VITITVETDEEQRLVQSPALFGGAVPEPVVAQVRVVRDGQVITAGGYSLGIYGGGGGSDTPGTPHPALRTHHVVTFDGEGTATLDHPASCAGKLSDCLVMAAFRHITPVMLTGSGKWTCDAGPGGFMLLEMLGS